MVERGRWRSSSSNPWSKQGELEQVTQHRVHSGVKYLQGLSLLFDHSQNKKWILSWLSGISSISDRPHCHLPFQWHYCGASGTLFFTTSHQIFIEFDYILLEPSIPQAEQSYLSQTFLIEEMLQTLIHPHGPLLDLLQDVHVSLTLGHPGLDPELQLCLIRSE